MDEILNVLSNPYVYAYFALIALCQMIYRYKQRKNIERIKKNRKAQGLPERVLLTNNKKLQELKADARDQALVLLVPIVVVPLIFIIIDVVWSGDHSVSEAKNGVLFAFLLMFVWVLLSGTDLAKATVGGIAFRLVTVFSGTFQIGDRVTIEGYSGKLIGIGIFYLTLVTQDDDKVCLPTNSLWGATLVTANDGNSCSLVVIRFYLSPNVTLDQLNNAEDAIWDAMQASNYFEPSKPKQIYYQQQKGSIELTAKAYVASTYNEPHFRSDITRRFLEFAKGEQGIRLAKQTNTLGVGVHENSAVANPADG